jgi:predicted Rossmann fold flavoprotein
MLLEECRKAKVEIRTNCSVKEIRKSSETSPNETRKSLKDTIVPSFEVKTNQDVFNSESLVIATGGLSFAKIGATDFGYKIARQFGLKTVETRPALVPLVFAKGAEDYKPLAGVSIDAAVSHGKAVFRENILFTHRGLSGPAILQISNYWLKGTPISVDLLPTENAIGLLENNRENRQTLDNFLAQFLPNRFSEIFTKRNFANKPLNQIGKREIEQTAQVLNDWQVFFGETEGYDKAEVTLGGISTNELSSQTMQAKRVLGLYFVGEVVDVTGWLGGYNFQWAWASGFAAGQVV